MLDVNEEPLTILVDEQGRLSVAGRAAQRRLAARSGRYRLVPSPPGLVILERVAAPQTQAQVAGAIVLAGELERNGGLIDIIHFIQTNAWSGHLAVLAGEARKTIYFRRGDVSTAASNVPEDRIGAILYRYGRITTAQLEEALAHPTQQRIGQHLVETGVLTAHDLYQYVRKQIEEIFHSTLVVRRGEFYFSRTADDEGPPSQLLLSTRELLFDGVRRIDEMGVFREKLPSTDVIPVRRPPPDGATLPEHQEHVLSLVDGARDLGTISRASHLGEFDTTKVLYQLLAAGWIEVRKPRPTTRPIPIAADPTHVDIIDTYNDVYAKIHAAVAAKGKLPVLQSGLVSFFNSVAEFAPLYAGVDVDTAGRLPRETLLANLDMAPTDNKLEYLQRGLNDLLFYELFTAGEAVDRAEELELHHRLNQILRDVPARDHA